MAAAGITDADADAATTTELPHDVSRAFGLTRTAHELLVDMQFSPLPDDSFKTLIDNLCAFSKNMLASPSRPRGVVSALSSMTVAQWIPDPEYGSAEVCTVTLHPDGLRKDVNTGIGKGVWRVPKVDSDNYRVALQRHFKSGVFLEKEQHFSYQPRLSWRDALRGTVVALYRKGHAASMGEVGHEPKYEVMQLASFMLTSVCADFHMSVAHYNRHA